MSKLSKTGMYKFWSTLRKIANNRRWTREIDECGNIRLFDKNGSEYCPLTAVYKNLKDEFVHSDCAKDAARELGIADEYAEAIMDAADDNVSVSRDRKFRNKLAKTLKLSKKEKSLRNQ